MHASGEFEVRLAPLDAFAEGSEGITLGRMSIDKTFTGDLTATSRGEMLRAATAVQGSAGYTAIEQVTGTLGGKTGSFVLQHSGTMTQGQGTTRVTVVPDSGSGELTGLTGSMEIIIRDGRHFFEFEYAIP